MTEQTHKTIGIAVVEYQGRFLVGIRPPGASLAGFAEFPGGKCEEAEAPAAAAEPRAWRAGSRTTRLPTVLDSC